MTTPQELFDAGDLRAAIAQLGEDVKARPTDLRQRTFLFELLCFAGELDRADKQLDVIGHQDGETQTGAQVFRQVLDAERARRDFFANRAQPAFLVPPPAYTQLYLDAVARVGDGKPAAAAALIGEAEEQRPALGGCVDGVVFADFRDSDDLIGPFLEVFVRGAYAWVPFEQIRALRIPAPRQLRDLLWTTATIESSHGFAGEVIVPVLYAGTNASDIDALRLGRSTEWRALDDDLSVGVGQRMFFVDTDVRAMLDVRAVELRETGSPAPDSGVES